MEGLLIGRERGAAAPQAVELPLAALLRHAMALGSSGSGKTVLCKAVVEECVLQGVPAICVDPQGDLCSLALIPANPGALAERGVDAARARRYAGAADVVVFTPASRTGVALSADPINVDLDPLGPEDRVQAVSGVAGMLVSLLGYRLDSDDGEGLLAVFDLALADLHAQGRFPRTLQAFSAYLAGLDADALARYARYLDPGVIAQAVRRLARLDVGQRRLLFHEGLSLDIDLLLGYGPAAAAVPGRTRVSVIYLNTLQSQEDREFFVAALAERLYAWMLQHPSPTPQALFYVDEVAPFIPPVRKPASKDALGRLFRQGRKYGVSCLMATQNPGDVDYKAMAQFGTWALGRLTTAQDQKKVLPTVKSLDPVGTDAIMAELPALRPGEFVLLSPDSFRHTLRLQARWLYSEHRTLDEERIRALADGRWRERFDALEARLRVATAPPVAPEPVPEQALAGESAAPPTPGPQAQPPAAAPAGPVGLERLDAALAERPAMGIAEFARQQGVGERTASARLRALESAGLAGRFRQGGRLVYWSRRGGLRPDLGLTGPVRCLVGALGAQGARELAAGLCRRRIAGLIGVDEQVGELHLEHRLLLRAQFHEKVARAFWRRILGPEHDEVRGSVYLHPRTLALVTYDPGRGLGFAERIEGHASQVADFDGTAAEEERLPGELELDPRDWQERVPDQAVAEALRHGYGATVRDVGPLLVPLWRVELRGDGGQVRIVRLDALAGREVAWP